MNRREFLGRTGGVAAARGYAADVYGGFGLDPLTPDPTEASDRLGMDQPRFARGTPRLAEGAEAEAIIARVARLSVPYGTAVRFDQGVGTVQVPA